MNSIRKNIKFNITPNISPSIQNIRIKNRRTKKFSPPTAKIDTNVGIFIPTIKIKHFFRKIFNTDNHFNFGFRPYNCG